jgi:hypothetical protein
MNEMSTGSYLVQKDRLLFRIEINLIGRLAKNVKYQYVRGYLTAASARKDIQRLDDHLQTKYIGSFKKHLGDDMDELLEPKCKRVCSRREKKVDDNDPSVKVLSGIVFIKLRRDLSWKDYKYKKQLKDTDTPYVSKDEWLEY